VAWVRRARTASGATAVQIAEYVDGRRRIVAHVGSAHTEAELGLLLERARGMLTNAGQDELDHGVEATPRKARLVSAVTSRGLFPVLDTQAAQSVVQPARVAAPRVVGTSSRLLFDVLAQVDAALGFAVVGDDTFRDLVIARIVEPTSILDTGRVLTDPGRAPASEKTLRRTLGRAQGLPRPDRGRVLRTRRGQRRCVAVPVRRDDVVLRGREGRRAAQGRLLQGTPRRPTGRGGSAGRPARVPLEIGCFEGNTAETTTIVPIIKAFQDRHGRADKVVVADAGMLSASNLRELDDADLRFIVGSRVTKAPVDLESHFRWHGDAFGDGQIIDTITPRTQRSIENDAKVKAEPVGPASLTCADTARTSYGRRSPRKAGPSGR